MTFALIEVEATAKKAARGAGYACGMAEAAAMAARRLCAHGIDGVAGLAGLLAEINGAELRPLAPGSLSGDGRGAGGLHFGDECAAAFRRHRRDRGD